MDESLHLFRVLNKNYKLGDYIEPIIIKDSIES